ncbi:MAG: DUF3800 domain-containing protein [Chloroflexi bacterium]|nr:DUF3800 domain-containing protein [Chloroflexota bacterium]
MADSTRARKKSGESRHYFVDEAGDGVIFANKGRVIIETPGCSRFFMLGLLDVPDPVGLQQSVDDLRSQLLSDPYFRDVPSMQPDERKTAVAFHAKDDLPEVRREVFSLLRGVSDLRFFAVVTDKWSVLDYVRQQNERSATYRYHPNELYDYLVRRLFKNRLHKDGGYEIVFSKRGATDRTAALRKALESARARFAQQWNIVSDAPMEVSAATPAEQAGLQAVDYFTWALQRLYEKREDRYLTYLWPTIHLVEDIDDKRKAGYGRFYTQTKPLTEAALAWRYLPGI